MVVPARDDAACTAVPMSTCGASVLLATLAPTNCSTKPSSAPPVGLTVTVRELMGSDVRNSKYGRAVTACTVSLNSKVTTQAFELTTATDHPGGIILGRRHVVTTGITPPASNAIVMLSVVVGYGAPGGGRVGILAGSTLTTNVALTLVVEGA
jgi:hypothetical protein